MGQISMWLAEYLRALTFSKGLTDLLAVVGLASTLSWMCGLWPQWRSYSEQRLEKKRKLALLRNTDQFIARVTHIGGEGTSSMI